MNRIQAFFNPPSLISFIRTPCPNVLKDKITAFFHFASGEKYAGKSMLAAFREVYSPKIFEKIFPAAKVLNFEFYTLDDYVENRNLQLSSDGI